MLRERRRHANFKPNRRLDRKSSRGMIYENEELRLRTININAEVERGQSDIRKLRRENEQLRREIWSLRDEYDRLNKLLRANRSTESCGGGGGGCTENNGNNSGTQDEESDSCDTCKDDDEDDDIICDEIHCNLHNRIKCDQDHHNFHHDQQQHQNQPSSSSSESKKKILSSSLPTTSSPLSSLSNNGSKEITENYENSQKSILDNNSSGSSSSNYKNCNSSNCSSPAGPSGKIYNVTTAGGLMSAGIGSGHGPEPGPGPGTGINDNRNSTISSLTNRIPSSDGCADGSDKLRENLHVNFDHLSIVSEENLTNSDGNSVQHNDVDPLLLTSSGAMEILNLQEPTAGSVGTTTTLATTVASTKDTNKKLLNRISDTESLVPPLSHFENISYEKIGPSLADLEDVNYSTSTTTTGDTVIAANGWDFSAAIATTTAKPNSLVPTTTSTGVQTQNDISSSSSSSIINHHQKMISTEMAISSSLKIAQHLFDTDSSSLSAIDSKSPKHFFSPLKPRLNVDLGHSLSTPSSPLIMNALQKQQHQQQQQQKQSHEKYENYNGPDVFVANALASSSSSPYHTQIIKPQKSRMQGDTEPIYASVQKPPSLSLKLCGESSFKTGGNLEDLLMDIETLSKDILQMQLKKQKSLSEDKLDGGGNDEDGNLSNRKPFRSEMNLVLTYNGTNPVITPIMKSTTSTSLNCGLGKDGYCSSTGDKDFSAATTMERGSTRGTPPLPNVPEPMTLFPENRPYLGFENFGQPPITSLAGGKPILSIFNKAQKKKLSSSETPEMLSSPITDLPNNIDTNTTTTTVIDKATSNIPNRNEEKLLKAVGSVKDSKELLLDKKKSKTKDLKTGNFVSETANCDSSSGSESTVKRKSRRVSILFRKSEDSSKDAKKNNEKCQNENKIETTPATTTEITSDHQSNEILNATITKLSTFSNNEIQANLINDEKNVQDSPHSERHKSNSSLTSGRHHHHHHHGHSHHHHHNQGRKMSQDSGTGKHPSKIPSSPGDDDNDRAATVSSYVQEQQQKSISHRSTKCGRRHSEGTVLATMAESGSNDGGNGCGSDTSGGGGNHHHHQHHHHHHTHSGISGHSGGGGGGVGGNGTTGGHHHHHHARHDSYNDGVGGTSLSERNSNSLASSRESSTSLSTRSQRRKISISSHSGGKIPWCGCWGNGCL